MKLTIDRAGGAKASADINAAEAANTANSDCLENIVYYCNCVGVGPKGSMETIVGIGNVIIRYGFDE